MRLRDGDSEFDCFAILDSMYATSPVPVSFEAYQDRWNLLWQDLLHKSAPLENRRRELVLNAALMTKLPRSFVPGDWRPLLSETPSQSAGKHAADVMLFCVIEQELNATLAAFGINQRTRKHDGTVAGHRFYKIAVRSKNCGNLSIWIGLIGEARNVVCANFCRDVFEQFSIRYFCALVGIAGGNKEKVQIGDVVASEEVVDIEGARVEQKVTKPRHRHYPLSGATRTMLMDFEPTRWGWLDGRDKGLEILKKSGSAVSMASAKRSPKYRQGAILSGEKLRRDGKLPALAHRFGDKFMAIEMEGSGFASSCERKKINWLIFRGISDYGDMKKRDEWQPLAAFHAALATKSFIVNALRPVDDVSF